MWHELATDGQPCGVCHRRPAGVFPESTGGTPVVHFLWPACQVARVGGLFGAGRRHGQPRRYSEELRAVAEHLRVPATPRIRLPRAWIVRSWTRMATLLQQLEEEERLHDIEACQATRLLLKEALHELVPGQKVVVFGSLAEPARFRRTSDVDIALEVEPASFSAHALGSMLEERLGRPVDVVLLSESRLEDSIRKKGETWIA